MALPRAVQAQADEADRIQAVLAAQQDAPKPTVGESPTAQPSAEAAAPQSVTPQPPTQPAAPAQPTEDWEQKYRSLRGLFEQKVPELQSQLVQRDQQLTQLSARLEELEKRTPTQQTTASQATPLVTQQDVEAYGADLVDLIGRKAQEVAASVWAGERQQLTEQLTKLEGRLGTVAQTSQQSAAEMFWSTLDRKVPDWQQLNTDVGFLTWLGERIPGTPLKRQSVMDDAVAKLDVASVQELFDSYRTLSQPAPKPTAPSIQRQVAPARTAGTPPPATGASQRVWTSQEIAAFYDKWRRGEYRAEDAARVEAEINAAAAEGRVTA